MTDDEKKTLVVAQVNSHLWPAIQISSTEAKSHSLTPTWTKQEIEQADN
jgi:hypothetical protein